MMIEKTTDEAATTIRHIEVPISCFAMPVLNMCAKPIIKILRWLSAGSAFYRPKLGREKSRPMFNNQCAADEEFNQGSFLLGKQSGEANNPIKTYAGTDDCGASKPMLKKALK